jgi:predicted RNA-binding Zn-ribbon protein involved in translation (DUF1610 family)
MPVVCLKCGQEWERDPDLEVPCPVCGAGVGQRCRRPSGHSGPFVGFHAERDILAMETLDNYGLCPKANIARRPSTQMSLPYLQEVQSE